MTYNPITSALLGVAVGDALGVPFEFKSRDAMQQNPATDMVGFGTHHQPRGTWSDDTSLTLCMAESLLTGYDLTCMASLFIRWKFNAYWTAHDEVFDIGMTTLRTIHQLRDLLDNGKVDDLPLLKYEGVEQDNGNGSLMRILPLLWEVKGKPIAEQFKLIWQSSALTHKHIRAAMCCLIYLKMAEHMLTGKDKDTAYQHTRAEIAAFWDSMTFAEQERAHFQRIIQQDIRDTDVSDIKTGGYVMESLESSLWFFLQYDNYKDTVLGIINLGHDTDTSGAIVGGLAGLYYGAHSMPPHWLGWLVRKEEIVALGNQLFATYQM